MRISSQQVFDSSVQSMQQHTSDVVEAQRQISSGQKYRLASDDALAAGLGVQIAWDKTQFGMFKVNQDHINASLTSTDAQRKCKHCLRSQCQRPSSSFVVR